MKNKLKVLVFLGTVISLIWFWPEKNFQVTFCDVGQGDAILFNYRYYQILVDGGADNQVLECLDENLPFWDRKLEMVILTHPEKDHYQGLLAVAERYRLLYFVWGGVGRRAVNFEKLLDQIGNSETRLITAKQGDEITIDKIKIKFYWPDKNWLSQQLSDKQENLTNLNQSDNVPVDQRISGFWILDENQEISFNNFSLVFTVSFENFDILMTGDADSRIQPQIIKSAKIPDSEIIKVAHHGSKYAFDDRFLASFKSRLAVISVGPNPWGHPTPELLNQLKKFNLPVLRTDQEGNIKIISDGKSWQQKTKD